MFRLKLGEHITIGNISRGPRAVIECDHINELTDLVNSGMLHQLIDINNAPANELVDHKTRMDRMTETLRAYGIEPPTENE